ncbi:hypothetical protein TrCOL_g427 [Triparma columacea]|uniref:phosphoribosylaminoimidazolesuccinocarboxamide synthase n=1 Tax=Triparma columacea TaxID=722753 RepID=A0A9W7GI04_9STRA|nr:hypothetical protein TrCOL_g427 [Triparma columacea]
MSVERSTRVPFKEGHFSKIEKCYDEKKQITGDEVGLDNRTKGKVRDQYVYPNSIVLVTTDRQSGFDRSLASVPYKGAVLNQISNFWFDKTKHIIPNHIISVPHPNVTVGMKCTPFPIEMVVRSYMTGSTDTSIWKNYQSGVRNYCGIELPEGMTKNQKLWDVLFTPTTKDEHDRPISCEDIVSEGFMSKADLDYCKSKCLEVFKVGQEWASKRGLILVDTKFECGKDKEGNIRLIDEVMTPDSSRYWIKETYSERVENGQEPENIDKEFLRLWFRANCDPYKDEVLPEAPRELVCELSRRYVGLYEIITGEEFGFGNQDEKDIKDVIEKEAK